MGRQPHPPPEGASLPASGESVIDFTAPDGSPRRARLHLPRGAPPFSAALILPGMALPGASHTDRFAASIAKELAIRGVGTLQCEGRWLQPGGASLHELDWRSEIDDSVATLQLMAQQPWVARDRCVVVGLGLGGIAAPLVVDRAGGVQGILSWSATAQCWPAYADATLRQQLAWREVPAAELARRAELRDGWFRMLADRSLDGDGLVEAKPAVHDLGIDESGYLGRPTSFWRQLCRLDPASSYGALDCRICTVRGASDFVCHPEDQESIVQAARQAGLPVEAVTLAGLDHLLGRANSAEESCRLGAGLGIQDQGRLARVIVAWIDGRSLREHAF